MDPNAIYSASNLLMAAVALGAAAFVLSGGRTRANVHLAIFFAVEGAMVIATGLGFLSAARGELYGWLHLNTMVYSLPFGLGFSFAYLAFLGIAVDSPLVRPFRPRVVRWTLAAVPALLLVAVFLRPSLAVDVSEGVPTAGPLMRFTFEVFMPWGPAAVALLATAAAIHAYVRAPPGSLAKRRAKAYAIAFVVNDLGTLSWMSIFAIPAGEAAYFMSEIVANLFYFAFVALLVKALLRDQLFDFDLKMKVGVKRGTIMAVFLAAFLIATAIAEQYLERYGALVGGAAAGALLLAVRPIERAADRIATAAMPSAADSPEYRLVKKREVYQAAAEGVYVDGMATERERAMLARLADQLGLTVSETVEIERRVRAAPAPATAQ